MPRKPRTYQKTEPTHQTNLSISNEAKLDVKDPIPFEVTGSTAFDLFTDKRFIPFLNPNNNFFKVLQEASILSPTNSACINSKVFMCSGKGLRIKDADERLTSEFADFQRKINNKRQSLGKTVDRIFSNYFRVGNVFIEMVRLQAGSTRKLHAYVRSFLDCRLGVPDANDTPQTVIISKKFRNDSEWLIDEKNSVELPIYNGDDTRWKKMPDGSERCMMHIKNEMDGYEYYGVPENVSSLPWQILEYKGARYNIDNFDNNMVIGGAIILEGNYSDAELTKAATRIKEQHTGDGKRGRWVVLGNKQGTGSIQNFQKQTDGDFLKLDEYAEQKIIDANNWDSALYGQNNSKGLGNGGNAYLKNIFKIKHRTVVEPSREVIIEEFITPFIEEHDRYCGTRFSNKVVEFLSVDIEDLVEEIEINSVITVDEGREKLGFESLGSELGKKLINGKA